MTARSDVIISELDAVIDAAVEYVVRGDMTSEARVHDMVGRWLRAARTEAEAEQKRRDYILNLREIY